MAMKKRALVSVSDKNGIVEFCTELEKLGYEIISTGGTLKTLSASGIKAISISDVTGFPECLDGRVKTLDPHVHAGILAMRSNPEHMQQLEKLDINTIDMVVVNLYPFKETVSKPNVDFADAVENIDIGGPTMLRSAAKNYQDVIVLIDPTDYETVLRQMKECGIVDINTRKYLMYKVYQHTAVYDTIIAGYLREQLDIEFPEQITFAYEKKQDMRYGENPHQSAVFYGDVFPYSGALTAAKQLHGKELSYNNINDTNGALDLLREFEGAAVVAVKHANPCGVGIGKSIAECYKKAYECDPVSIYGGIIAANGEIDSETAEMISKIFVEIVVAKSFSKQALEILTKKANIRLLELPTINAPLKAGTYDMKKVVGGLLVQEINRDLFTDEFKVVTKTQPTKKQIEDMKFAMKVVKHTKSNAIVVANDGMSVGVGAGQTNRIWAAEQAIAHAEGKLDGAVMASDAFFPFSDCVDAAAKAGIKAIIQPGGSIRDNDSIEACDKYGIAMVFTGMRHFKH